jgi:cell division protein FtsW
VADGASAPALDGGIVSAASILAGIGIVMVYSTTAPLQDAGALPAPFVRQASALFLGLGLAAGAAAIPLSVWRGMALPLWLISVAGLAATFVIGVEVNGARRWLPVPGTGGVVQPAELAKLATVLLVASLLAHRDGRSEVSFRRMLLALVVAAVPAGLLVRQPDLGNAILAVGLVGLLLFVGGVPLRILAAPVVAGIAAVGVYVAGQPYALRRVEGFLDPWATAHEQGYQLVQSFVAFGRGGILGVGWGNGLQKLHYLPEAHNDFILAVLAEELGLVGILIVLGAFTALLVAGCRIALRAKQRFAMLTAFGVTVLLVVPAIVNGAVVMGLVPTKGLTLPFLSYGRSSILVCFLAIGLLLGIGRREARAEARAVGTATPRGLHP